MDEDISHTVNDKINALEERVTALEGGPATEEAQQETLDYPTEEVESVPEGEG